MRNITKSIALFVVCAFILPFCIVFASATGFESVAETSTKTTDSTENASTTPNENLNASQAGQMLPDCKNITAIIASDVVPLEEYAQISFESNSVTSYTFEVENVKILQSTETQITFQLQSNSKFGSLHVTATFEDGGTAIETVYLYKENDLVFVSNLGLDDAFRKAMQYHYDQGLISQAEWETAYSEFIKAYIYCIDFDGYLTNNNEVIINGPTAIQSTTSNSLVVSSVMYWGLNSSSVLPLRHVQVKLYETFENKIYNELGSTITDENGNFYFEISPEKFKYVDKGSKICIRVYPISNSISVGSILDYFEYTLGSVSFGGEYSLGIVLGHDSNLVLCKMFYLQQVMVIGERFAIDMGADFEDEKLSVTYPLTIGLASWSWQGVAHIKENHYNNADVVLHEYGHFVQQTQGFGLTLLDLGGIPMHSLEDDQLAEIDKAKTYAEKLVWTESWASTFSNIAQNLYSEEYNGVNLNSINFYGNYNCETPVISQNSSAFQEWAITALLWDLYDNPSISNITEAHDNISLTSLRWWQLTTQNGLYTLSEFMESAKIYYPEYLDEIGAIMAEYQISPGELSVTNSDSVSYNIAPIVRWRRNGSINNPNTVYQVTIYDAYNNELALCEVVVDVQSAYNDYMEFTIPIDTWRQVLKYYVSNFKIQIAVKAWNHISEPMTGPYLSDFYSFNMDYSDSTNLIIYNTNRYYEKKIKLDKGQYHDFFITFRTGGRKLIQTFGNEDTKLFLYSTDGTLLASNDDGGYRLNAFIAYEVGADEQYIVRVQFYSASNYGETKLSILTAEHILADITQDFECFEDIYCLQTKTDHSFGGSIQKGHAEIFAFKPPVAGTYTFTIESDYDTYMYIIDPRSSELLVINVDYNDDSGEGMNPLLNKTLEAGIPYLIVITALNPSAIENSISIQIIVSST